VFGRDGDIWIMPNHKGFDQVQVEREKAEVAKSQSAFGEFVRANPKLVADADAMAVLESRLQRLFVEDLQ
jgi:hypothetical protein